MSGAFCVHCVIRSRLVYHAYDLQGLIGTPSNAVDIVQCC